MPDSLERRAMKALGPGRVTYLPASFNKRFARSMEQLAEQETYTLTDRQRWLLWRMVFRYRRQIGDRELLAEALRHENDSEPAPAKAKDKAPRPPQPLPGKKPPKSICTRSGRLRRK